MSSCGCDFTAANGLFISSGTSTFDPATSNNLYTFTINSSNINYNYSSNKFFFTDSNISNIYFNNRITDSNVSNLLYYNDSNISNIYYNTGFIDSNLLWWRYELLNTQLELANTKLTVAGLNTSLNITTTTVSAQGFTLGVHTGQIDVLENKVENLENNTFTKLETSNIFTTSNVLSNTSNFLVNYNNLINKPIIFTQIETSNIFTTSNVLSNTSNFLVNYDNLINKPIIFTQIETSNIFTTSNVLSNTSNILADYNNLYNRPDVYTKIETNNNFYTKTQTDNTFTTLTQSNLLYFSLKNDITNTNNNNKWIVNGNNLYTLDYNIGIGKNIPNYKVDINGSLSSTDYRFNDKQLFSLLPTDSPIFNSAISTQISPTQYYVSYTQNDTMITNKPYTVDILIVGAGGRGGSGAFAGGGGAGEVIYIPNYTLNTGIYNIKVGIDSSIINDRISKLTFQPTLTDLITATGGGDGGDLLATITNTTNNYVISKSSFYTFNYETTIYTLPIGTYNITFASGSITLNSIVDTSYPILKDVNGDNINPTTWYKFDNTTNFGIDEYGLANMTNTSATQIAGIKGTNCISLNGTSAFLATTTATNLTGISFSICFWTYFSSLTGNRFVYCFGSGTGANGLMYIGYSSGTTSFRWSLWSEHLETPMTSANDLNIWNFWVLTFNPSDGNRQTIYKNGVSVATRQATIGVASTQNYRIGRYQSGTTNVYYSGRIDDFRIYANRILTLTQINELYRGRVNLFENSQSGGSGGGGYGSSLITSLGATSGNPFNATYSKLNAGANGITTNGGNGGSALISSRYTDPISGILVGAGGTGATISSTPITKINYGDGGDGNGGLGRQGIVIIKFTGDVITKFLEYTDYNKLFNKPTLLTKEETSNIFTTSNVASNTSNFLVNYNNLINKPDVYTKTEIDTNIFTKTEINNNFYNKTQIDNNIYTKTQSDTNYYTKANVYTKTESDNNYYNKSLIYTKTESDNNYYNKSLVYTKTESDNNYYTKANVYTKTESDNNYYNKSQIDTFNSYRPMTSNITQKLTGSILSLTLVSGGSGYASFLTNQPLTFTGGGGQNASGTYNTNGSGSVSSITLTSGGILYTSTAVQVKAGTGNAVISATMEYFDFHNVYSALNINGKPDIVYKRCDLAFGTRDPTGISYQEGPDGLAGALGTNGFCGLRVKDERMFLIANSNLILTSFENNYLGSSKNIFITANTSNIELMCNNVNSQILMKSKTTFEKEVIFTGGVSKKIPKYFTTSRIASFDGISCLAFDINLQTNGVNTTTILGYVFRVFRISFFFITKAPRFQWTPRTFEIHMSSFDGNSVSAFDGYSAYSSLDKSYNYQWFLYRQNFSQITFCCPTALFGTTHLDVGFVLEDLLAI